MIILESLVPKPCRSLDFRGPDERRAGPVGQRMPAARHRQRRGHGWINGPECRAHGDLGRTIPVTWSVTPLARASREPVRRLNRAAVAAVTAACSSRVPFLTVAALGSGRRPASSTGAAHHGKPAPAAVPSGPDRRWPPRWAPARRPWSARPSRCRRARAAAGPGQMGRQFRAGRGDVSRRDPPVRRGREIVEADVASTDLSAAGIPANSCCSAPVRRAGWPAEPPRREHADADQQRQPDADAAPAPVARSVASRNGPGHRRRPPRRARWRPPR